VSGSVGCFGLRLQWTFQSINHQLDIAVMSLPLSYWGNFSNPDHFLVPSHLGHRLKANAVRNNFISCLTSPVSTHYCLFLHFSATFSQPSNTHPITSIVVLSLEWPNHIRQHLEDDFIRGGPATFQRSLLTRGGSGILKDSHKRKESLLMQYFDYGPF
jgi:hypothetical protein